MQRPFVGHWGTEKVGESSDAAPPKQGEEESGWGLEGVERCPAGVFLSSSFPAVPGRAQQTHICDVEWNSRHRARPAGGFATIQYA